MCLSSSDDSLSSSTLSHASTLDEIPESIATLTFVIANNWNANNDSICSVITMIVHLPRFLRLTLIGIPPMVVFPPIIPFPTLVGS